MTTPHPEEPAEGAREPGETDQPQEDEDGSGDGSAGDARSASPSTSG